MMKSLVTPTTYQLSEGVASERNEQRQNNSIKSSNLLLSLTPFMSLSCHSVLTKWAVLLPKWLIDSTLCCPVYEQDHQGKIMQPEILAERSWQATEPSAAPAAFKGISSLRGKGKGSSKGAAVRHLLWGTGLKNEGGSSIIYHKEKSRTHLVQAKQYRPQKTNTKLKVILCYNSKKRVSLWSTAPTSVVNYWNEE